MVSHKLVAHSVIETGGEAEWMMLCFQYLDNPRLRVVGKPSLGITSRLLVNRKELTPASVNREVLWTPKTDAS